MVSTSTFIIFAFLLGTLMGAYCIRLGMQWGQVQRGEEPKPLPIMPVVSKPPPEPEQTEQKQDKTLQHWFVGGEDKQ